MCGKLGESLLAVCVEPPDLLRIKPFAAVKIALTAFTAVALAVISRFLDRFCVTKKTTFYSKLLTLLKALQHKGYSNFYQLFYPLLLILLSAIFCCVF